MTELLVEGKLDESMEDFFDQIAANAEWQKENDIYDPELHRKKVQKAILQEKELQWKLKQLKIAEKSGVDIKVMKAWRHIREFGISKEVFVKNYKIGSERLMPLQISEQLLACEKVSIRCKKAEMFAKAANFALVPLLGKIFAGMYALFLAKKTLGEIFIAVCSFLPTVLGEGKDAEEGLDGSWADQSSKIPPAILFGFDAEVVDQMTAKEQQQLFDDQVEGYSRHKKQRGKRVSNIHNQLTYQQRKETETDVDKDGLLDIGLEEIDPLDAHYVWDSLLKYPEGLTMAEFQHWLMLTFKGPEVADQWKSHEPDYGWIDWVGILEDLQSFGEFYRTGWDKWLGGWDQPLEILNSWYRGKFLGAEEISGMGIPTESDLDAFRALEELEMIDQAQKGGWLHKDNEETQEKISKMGQWLRDNQGKQREVMDVVTKQFGGSYEKAFKEAGIRMPAWVSKVANT